MSGLFDPLKIREVSFKNRIFVSPMCQYSAQDGVPNDWHLVHLGSRAVGGAGLVLWEATSVSPEGRISPEDTGLWNSQQEEAFARINKFIEHQGSVPGIQLAHAGRKSGTASPWKGGRPLDLGSVWKILAPSAIPFAEGYQTPMEMGQNELDLVVEQFVQAAERSFRAGFKVLEIHMAHGYLLHEFLSPLSNRRSDEYGGIRKGRMAFPLRVVQSVREVWPLSLPLFVRISATDWRDQDGWSLDDSVELSHQLKQGGVDLIDCSSGGNSFQAEIPFEPGYQVRFAEEIRRECDILTGAVGLITQAHQAEQILIEGKADAVLLGRELLRDPYWPLHAARELGLKTEWPLPYQRA